jgi:hypothetical protein
MIKLVEEHIQENLFIALGNNFLNMARILRKQTKAKLASEITSNL